MLGGGRARGEVWRGSADYSTDARGSAPIEESPRSFTRPYGPGSEGRVMNQAQPSSESRVKTDMEAVAALRAPMERDAELMLRVRDGDTTSFALLLDRHRTPVVHFLFRMVQNQAVAEELAQEVFLRIYRSRE